MEVYGGNALPLSGGTLTGGLTGTTLVMSGAMSGASLALGGATIGSNALAVTGTTQFFVGASNPLLFANVTGATTYGLLSFNNSQSVTATLGIAGGGDSNLYLKVPTGGVINAQVNNVTVAQFAPALFRLGAADAAAPVAQTLSVQSVVAGTSNTAGADWTQTASVGTGTGVGGDYVVQVAPAGSTGTAQNTLVDALRIKGTKSVVLGSAALATNATDGFLYVASGAGTPTGTPTAFTGRVAMYVDTTNSQLWFYLGGAWKQPKTPAAAATVTWQ